MEIEEKWIQKYFRKYGYAKGIGIILLVSWLPLVVLSALAGHDPLLDPAANLRFLIALPCFLISYPLVIHKFNWVINHFYEAKIISQHEIGKLSRIIDSMENYSNSKTVKIALVIFIYCFMYYESTQIETLSQIPWRSLKYPCGWWFTLISEPLYFYVFLNFILRISFWWRLLFNISLLKLRIMPAHGDGVGGIGFLSTTLNTLLLPSFAFSSSAAGGAANLIIYGGFNFSQLQISFVGFAIFLLFIFVTPLLFFIPALLKAREAAVHVYGRLASVQLNDFDQKWLKHQSNIGEDLSEPDSSAVTDFGSEVSRVHNIKLVPIKISDLIGIVIVIGLPFLPVYALKMPWKVLLERILGILR